MPESTGFTLAVLGVLILANLALAATGHWTGIYCFGRIDALTPGC